MRNLRVRWPTSFRFLRIREGMSNARRWLLPCGRPANRHRSPAPHLMLTSRPVSTTARFASCGAASTPSGAGWTFTG